MARITLDLDNRLVAIGMKLTGCKTKKQVVNLALKELVARKRRKKILELEGKIAWVGDLSEKRKHQA